jgi:hypothetical protein
MTREELLERWLELIYLNGSGRLTQADMLLRDWPVVVKF